MAHGLLCLARMTTNSKILTVAIAALSLAACSDPAKGKPKAETSAAKPEAAKTEDKRERLEILPATSKIEFTAAKVTRSHSGGFTGFKGTIELAPSKPEASLITVSIETATVFTDDPKLTDHLKSKDFFEVATFPTATFTSTAIIAGGTAGGTHTITGNLELHGVKKSISFPATITIDAGQVTAKAEFSINRKDWGIVYPGMKDDLIRDGVVIRLDIVAKRTPTT